MRKNRKMLDKYGEMLYNIILTVCYYNLYEKFKCGMFNDFSAIQEVYNKNILVKEKGE